jgi:hypothetical protein
MANQGPGNAPPASRNVWEIIGYDSTTEIFRTEVPVGLITPDKLNELLRILAAKYGNLTDEELVGSLRKRGTRRYRAHLVVHRSNDDARRRITYMCGENPHFVARLREAT